MKIVVISDEMTRAAAATVAAIWPSMLKTARRAPTGPRWSTRRDDRRKAREIIKEAAVSAKPTMN
jgi:hypothetical protein